MHVSPLDRLIAYIGVTRLQDVSILGSIGDTNTLLSNLLVWATSNTLNDFVYSSIA